jgi:hypothetical protein
LLRFNSCLSPSKPAIKKIAGLLLQPRKNSFVSGEIYLAFLPASFFQGRQPGDLSPKTRGFPTPPHDGCGFIVLQFFIYFGYISEIQVLCQKEAEEITSVYCGTFSFLDSYLD